MHPGDDVFAAKQNENKKGPTSGTNRRQETKKIILQDDSSPFSSLPSKTIHQQITKCPITTKHFESSRKWTHQHDLSSIGLSTENDEV